MQEELKKLMEELKQDIDKIIIRREGTFNNKSNKPYWDLEKKYKEKAKIIKDKYNNLSRGETMNYIIRLASDSDCEELSRLKHTCWNETYRGIYPDHKIDNYDYKKHEKKFLNIVSNKDVELYTVEDNNKLIGYMDYGKPYRPYKDYKQEIGLLYLLKKYQKEGLGRKLFDLAYNMIKENGYDEFFISCNKYNTNAIEFYKRMGGIIDHIDEDNVDKSLPQVKFLYKINR